MNYIDSLNIKNSEIKFSPYYSQSAKNADGSYCLSGNVSVHDSSFNNITINSFSQSLDNNYGGITLGNNIYGMPINSQNTIFNDGEILGILGEDQELTERYLSVKAKTYSTYLLRNGSIIYIAGNFPIYLDYLSNEPKMVISLIKEKNILQNHTLSYGISYCNFYHTFVTDLSEGSNIIQNPGDIPINENPTFIKVTWYYEDNKFNIMLSDTPRKENFKTVGRCIFNLEARS